MKTFKYILVAILSVNIFVWLITYFLNINLFTILQIQTSNLAIEEPRYKLNANSSNAKGNLAIEEPRYKLNSDMQEDVFDPGLPTLILGFVLLNALSSPMVVSGQKGWEKQKLLTQSFENI